MELENIVSKEDKQGLLASPETPREHYGAVQPSGVVGSPPVADPIKALLATRIRALAMLICFTCYGGLVYGYQAIQSMLRDADVFGGKLEKLKFFPSLGLGLTCIFAFLAILARALKPETFTFLRLVGFSAASTVSGGVMLFYTGTVQDFANRDQVALLGFVLVAIGGGVLEGPAFDTGPQLLNSKKDVSDAEDVSVLRFIQPALLSALLVVAFDGSSLWPVVFKETELGLTGFAIFCMSAGGLGLFSAFWLREPPLEDEGGEEVHPPLGWIVGVSYWFVVVVFVFYYYIATQLEQVGQWCGTKGTDSHDAELLNSIFNAALPIGAVVFLLMQVTVDHSGAFTDKTVNALRFTLCWLFTLVMVAAPLSSSPWAQMANVIVTPFLRLHSWAAMLVWLGHYCDRKWYLGVFGCVSMIIGGLSLSFQAITASMDGDFHLYYVVLITLTAAAFPGSMIPWKQRAAENALEHKSNITMLDDSTI